MTSFKSRIRMVCVAGTIVVLTSAVPASAQPMMGSRWFWLGPGEMMGPGGMGGVLCGPGGAGLGAWRIDAIERAVQPTYPQRAAFNELKDVSNKAAGIIAGACPHTSRRAPARGDGESAGDHAAGGEGGAASLRGVRRHLEVGPTFGIGEQLAPFPLRKSPDEVWHDDQRCG